MLKTLDFWSNIYYIIYSININRVEYIANDSIFYCEVIDNVLFDMLKSTRKVKNTRRRTIMRDNIIIACTECKQRNYDSQKNKKNDPDRIEVKKYCKFCKKHTVHKETK